MTLRIIDNQRIELTDSEFQLYQEICKSYDTPKMKGADLFKDLFQTDQKGFIIFLRPPNKTYTSMEAYLFIVNIMIHQNLGHACNVSSAASKLCLEATKEAKDVIAEARQIIDDMKKSREL
jgi:hypothetical protein